MDKKTASEQRVVLSNVSWQQFERLLAELGAERSTRLTYDRGRLELITPTDPHRRCDRLIESLILLLADEIELTVTAARAVVLTCAEQQVGIEPDACYFFGAPPQLAPQLDLRQATPPDLAVHVCVTPSSLDALPLYAELRVAEIWQYVAAEDKALRGALTIYQLDRSDFATPRYVKRAHSTAFPCLGSDRIAEFVAHSDAVGLATALQVLRSWLQQQGLSREF